MAVQETETHAARPVGDALAARVERERMFYDAKARARGYSSARGLIRRSKGAFDRHQDFHEFFDPRGKRVVDYGCGNGDLTLQLLVRGAAHVTSFDVSPGFVELAAARVAEHGLADRADVLVADAHHLELADESVELVAGVAILHHLDLKDALPELKRVLAPGGRAVFVEPLGHNPVLRLGRALTPSARTPDERPLTARDWELCASVFPQFEHHERELLTILFMPLNLVLRPAWQRKLAGVLSHADGWLLRRFPFLGRYARLTILVFQKS
jgi:ubiquinone/menaquinone biosynthesis C-methylase UbiE